jgi:hypothetical protein
VTLDGGVVERAHPQDGADEALPLVLMLRLVVFLRPFSFLFIPRGRSCLGKRSFLAWVEFSILRILQKPASTLFYSSGNGLSGCPISGGTAVIFLKLAILGVLGVLVVSVQHRT